MLINWGVGTSKVKRILNLIRTFESILIRICYGLPGNAWSKHLIRFVKLHKSLPLLNLGEFSLSDPEVHMLVLDRMPIIVTIRSRVGPGLHFSWWRMKNVSTAIGYSVAREWL